MGRVARIVARAAGGAAPASSPRGGGGVGDERGRRDAGPSDPAPSYAAIDGNPVNALFFRVFRNKLEERVGFRSDVEVRSRHTHTHTHEKNLQTLTPPPPPPPPQQQPSLFLSCVSCGLARKGYDGLIEVIRVLNSKSTEEVQRLSRLVLLSLFPSWLPPAFRKIFAGPLPDLSYAMNAWVTSLACEWLMGPTELNEVEVEEDSGTRTVPGVLVKRCRYLEEAGCASACVNSCKMPTQEFFKQDMGLNVTLEPNYEDFSCQFVFGKEAPPAEEDVACETRCFKQCSFPRAGRLEGRCPTVAGPAEGE